MKMTVFHCQFKQRLQLMLCKPVKRTQLEYKRLQMILIVSSSGMLAKRDFTSKLDMTTSLELKLRLSNSWAKEKESRSYL